MSAARVMRFLAAGGVAAAVNFFSRIGLSEFLPYVPSILFAYCLGMATAFALNRAFVFRGGIDPIGWQAAWFVLVNALAVGQTVAISVLLARWLLPAVGVREHVETIAHAFGVVIPVFTSYFGHKHLSFRGSRAS